VNDKEWVTQNSQELTLSRNINTHQNYSVAQVYGVFGPVNIYRETEIQLISHEDIEQKVEQYFVMLEEVVISAINLEINRIFESCAILKEMLLDD